MSQPWKTITCPNKECLRKAFDKNGKVKKDFKLSPVVDTAQVTQFTCPRCGYTETWGVTRMQVAETLYNRLAKQEF